MQNTPSKIFIIGLPRTGTTSLCASFLSLGYKVAHTAYTEHAFQNAQVIADTPVFQVYKYLDKCYPNAKFIYLTREQALWVPSIKKLLNRMYKNVVSDQGGFNPMIKEAYNQCFSPFNYENINDEAFLEAKYQAHEDDVFAYFKGRETDLLTINLAENNAWLKLRHFLKIEPSLLHTNSGFPHMNINGKVTAWNDVKHPLKIPSTHNGRIDKLSFTM